MENIEENDLAKDRRKPHKKEPKKTKVTKKKYNRDNMIINEDGMIKISNIMLGLPLTKKRTKDFLDLLGKVKKEGNSSLPANLRTIMHIDSYPAGGGFIIYAIGIKEDTKRGKNEKGNGKLLSMILAVDTKTKQACCFVYKMDFISSFIVSHFICCDNEEDFDKDFKLLEEKIEKIKEIRKERFKNKKDYDLRDWKNTSR